MIIPKPPEDLQQGESHPADEGFCAAAGYRGHPAFDLSVQDSHNSPTPVRDNPPTWKKTPTTTNTGKGQPTNLQVDEGSMPPFQTSTHPPCQTTCLADLVICEALRQLTPGVGGAMEDHRRRRSLLFVRRLKHGYLLGEVRRKRCHPGPKPLVLQFETTLRTIPKPSPRGDERQGGQVRHNHVCCQKPKLRRSPQLHQIEPLTTGQTPPRW